MEFDFWEQTTKHFSINISIFGYCRFECISEIYRQNRLLFNKRRPRPKN
jgi:hypothetical protein